MSLRTGARKGPEPRRPLYAEAWAADPANDRRAEVTLWHDGRVGVAVRVDSETVFALSYYPAAVMADPADGPAVAIDRGADLIREPVRLAPRSTDR